jgi:hypothetical protein
VQSSDWNHSNDVVFPVRGAFFIFLLAIFFAMSTGAWAQQPAAASPSASASTQAAPTNQAPANQAPTNQAPAAAPAATPGEKAAQPENRPSLPPGFDPVKKMPLYETIQEDWSSLQVGASHLDPEPPLALPPDDEDGFTRYLVQVKWRPGDPLDLYVVLPKGVKNPPAVLYLFGYKEDTDRFRDNRWCKEATAGGVAVIGFVSALSASRFHDRPMRQWFVSELQESLGSTVHDVKFILDYLAQRGDIDMQRIGMFGQSSGGAIALLAAAADPRIKVVDALDPWGDWPVWLEKSWVVNVDPEHAHFTDPAFLNKVAPLDPVKWLPTLKSTRIRIQQVMDNNATPDECKDALRKAAPKQTEIVRWDHATQFFDASGGGKLYEWIKTQVKTLPGANGVLKDNVAARSDTPNVTGNGPTKKH